VRPPIVADRCYHPAGSEVGQRAMTDQQVRGFGSLIYHSIVEVRSLGFRTDLAVRKLAGSEIVDRREYLTVRTRGFPAFYWGNFVLVRQSMTDDAERCLDLFAAEFSDAPHVAIGVDGTDGSVIDSAGFESSGVATEVGVVLTAETAPHVDRPNTTASFRPLRRLGDWAQLAELHQVVDTDEGQDSPQHMGFIKKKAEETRKISLTDRAEHFGAFVGDRLVSSLGVVSDGKGTARYQAVVTHPDSRRQGLAGTLVVLAGEYGLEQLGCRRLVILADPVGPALGLYRGLGFSGEELAVQLLRPPRRLLK
jgi:ribosomal protein S18 acetylase RimI-like enzyme